MDADFGLVSIITPNYNCARYIEQTIESVQKQTYQNWELLIQDDCSTDESVFIARQWAREDSRIKIEVNPCNCGAGITRNNAISRAKGDWLAFLDSDDLWLSNKLELQLRWMAENDCDFSFTQYEHINEKGYPLLTRARVINRLSYSKMLFHCWTGCLTVMYRNDSTILGPELKKCNDYALFLSVLKSKRHARGIPECTAFYRIRKQSISRNKWAKVKPYMKVMHGIEGYNYLTSCLFLFTNLFIKLFFKYKKINPSQSLMSKPS